MDPKNERSGKKSATYAGAGVSYQEIDPIKILGQRLGRQTVALRRQGIHMPEPCENFRGESAYAFKMSDGSFIAHVEEGLGTKVILADTIYEMTGNPKDYSVVAQDTVAMIVNDMITLGILPFSMQMHLAVGSSDWLKDMARMRMLMRGWREACVESGTVWSGGETPVLKGIVDPSTAVLAGSAVGYLSAQYRPIVDKIAEGDVIVGFASSGIHANGISLLRQTAKEHPDDLLMLYAEALKPTRIYVRLMRELLLSNIRPHYAIHMTGHGWRKLMRAPSPFTYAVNFLPRTPIIFGLLQRIAKISEREMWANYNMGVGFAIIVSAGDVDRVMKAATKQGYNALVLGYVKKGPKKVVIRPKGITFTEDSMAIR